MAPKFALTQKKRKINYAQYNIIVKKLNRALKKNAELHKHIQFLSIQNREFSATRNNLLLQKMELENENNSLQNSNTRLTAINATAFKKLSLIEESLQKNCVPALVTLSQCIPNMLEIAHEMKNFHKLTEFNNQEKKEKQTKTVRPMIKGMTINQPAVSLKRLDMSPIIESPISEEVPKRPRISSYRSVPSCKLNLEPYVRLKDVATLLKNSKVTDESHSKRQLEENLGEGPSWLYTQEIQNTSVREILSPVSNDIFTENKPLEYNEMQLDASASNSINIENKSLNNNSLNNETRSSTESSMLKNITSRKRRSINNTSVTSALNDSTSSRRSVKISTTNMTSTFDGTGICKSEAGSPVDSSKLNNITSRKHRSINNKSVTSVLNDSTSSRRSVKISTTNMTSTFDGTEICKSEAGSPVDSSKLKNITIRKHRSINESNTSDFNDSSCSLRSTRARKNVNYKEPKGNSKLRRP